MPNSARRAESWPPCWPAGPALWRATARPPCCGASGPSSQHGGRHDPAPERSELEERFLALVRQAGLPQPEVNVRIAGHTVDILWRDRRVVVETDGWGAHRTRRAFEADRARDLALHLAGLVVHRFTDDRVVRGPAEAAALLARLLARQ